MSAIVLYDDFQWCGFSFSFNRKYNSTTANGKNFYSFENDQQQQLQQQQQQDLRVID